MSKRKLLELVEKGHVTGWNDPRMPTLSGLRRRGFTPASIRNFVEKNGVAKRDSIMDIGVLEHSIREDLNKTANRVMAVVNPIKVVITNYPEDHTEELSAINNPEDAEAGTRIIPFSRELYIEKEDFLEAPRRKFYRLYPGNEVRLRYAYIIKCESFIKNDNDEIVEIHCTYDKDSKSGGITSARKVKGTIHWVSAKHAFDAEVRNYDRLFNHENPAGDKETDFLTHINPDSLTILPNCKLEPSLKSAKPGERVQFERRGYYCVDTIDSLPDKPVFNRIVTLRDSWARIAKKQ